MPPSSSRMSVKTISRAFAGLLVLPWSISCRDKSGDSGDGSSEADAGADPAEVPSEPCLTGAAYLDENYTPYASIQAAIDAATNGSVVHVCPGRHYETLQLSYGVSPIFIQGTSAEETYIDGEEQGPVFDISQIDAEISDITITGGSGLYLTPSDLSFYSIGGGLLFNYTYSLVLNRVRIEGNRAGIGAGMSTYGPCDIHVVINDSIIRDNIADDKLSTDGVWGGGAFLADFYLLESYNTDWGEGDTDNEPHDLAVLGDAGFVSVSIVGTDSFICDSDKGSDPCYFID